jgi:hypothetical protein
MITFGPTCNITWCSRFWSEVTHSATAAEYILKLERRDRRYLQVLWRLNEEHSQGILGLPSIDSILQQQEAEDTLFRANNWFEQMPAYRQSQLTAKDLIQDQRLVEFFEQKNRLLPPTSAKLDLTRWEDD